MIETVPVAARRESPVLKLMSRYSILLILIGLCVIIAILTGGLFLRINGRKLSTSSKDLEAVTLRMATKAIQVRELAAWLQENAITVKSERKIQ